LSKKILPKLLIYCFILYSSLAIGRTICLNEKSPYIDKLSNQSDFVNIAAENSVVSDRNQIYINGDVELSANDFYLGADNVFAESSSKKYRASGNIRFLNEFISAEAEKLEINDKFIDAKNLNFQFINSSAKGSAERLKGSSEKQIITNSTFSNCTNENKDWTIHSDSLVLDKKNNLGVATNAKLVFFGVPILYFPSLEWPLEGRGSGFLSPAFSQYKEKDSNTSESSISIPYYFNIAKDKDFLVTLNNLSSRGVNFATKYRQLLSSEKFYESGYIELENNFLGDDHITKNDRWLTKSKINLDLSHHLKLNVENYRVSDKDYFNEISKDSFESNLLSFLELNYLKDNLQIDFEYNKNQVIDSSESSFVYSPMFSAKRSFSDNNRNMDLSFNAVKFSDKYNSLNGSKRIHYEANINESFEKNSFEITPELSFLSTYYDIKNSKSFKRNIIKFSADSKIDLERELDINGTKITQSFSPRLKYNFVQKKKQSHINNFDTEEFALNAPSLFNSQNFTGLDKISNANSFTYGFDSEFFNYKNDEYIFGTSIAQKRNFDKQSLGIDGNFITSKRFSDIYTTTTFNYGDAGFNLLLNYDPYKNRLSSSALIYDYYISPKKLINVGYINDLERTLNLSASYPVSKKLSVFGSLNKNLTINSINKGLFGIAYETCCWELTVAKFNDKDNIRNDSLELELVFKDLGSSSNSLKKRIKSQIPNYLKTDDF